MRIGVDDIRPVVPAVGTTLHDDLAHVAWCYPGPLGRCYQLQLGAGSVRVLALHLLPDRCCRGVGLTDLLHGARALVGQPYAIDSVEGTLLALGTLLVDIDGKLHVAVLPLCCLGHFLDVHHLLLIGGLLYKLAAIPGEAPGNLARRHVTVDDKRFSLTGEFVCHTSAAGRYFEIESEFWAVGYLQLACGIVIHVEVDTRGLCHDGLSCLEAVNADG